MAIDSSKDKDWNKQMEMIYKEEQKKCCIADGRTNLEIEQEKIIQKLIEENKKLQIENNLMNEICKDYKTKDQEIKKLNNIIEELEKDLIDSIKYWENQEKLWQEEGFMKFGGEANNKIIFKGVLKTLRELKEGK